MLKRVKEWFKRLRSIATKTLRVLKAPPSENYVSSGNIIHRPSLPEEGWNIFSLNSYVGIDYEKLVNNYFTVKSEKHTRYLDVYRAKNGVPDNKWPYVSINTRKVDGWNIIENVVLIQGFYKSLQYGDEVQLHYDSSAYFLYKAEHYDFVLKIVENSKKDDVEIIPKIDTTKVEVSHLVERNGDLYLRHVNLKDSKKYNPKDYNLNYTDTTHDMFRNMLECVKSPGNAVHILHGPPGCGKTALIKKLVVQVTRQTEDYKIIYLSPNLLSGLGNADFTGWLMDMCERVNGPIVFIFEDTGEFIAQQTSDSRHPSTVAILNIIDGILGESLGAYGIHMVISYNNLEQVDDAILRRAKTNAYIGPLSADHADAWCEHHKIPPLGESMTLSSLYLYRDEVSSERQKRSSQRDKSDTELGDYPAV